MPAPKKETAKESIAKLDKAIAYKSEALDTAINNTFAEINDVIDDYKRSTDKLSELASKVSGLIELSNSIKESVNLKNSYQNIKDVNGAKVKVPEISEEILKLGLEIRDAPECTENSDPESIPICSLEHIEDLMNIHDPTKAKETRKKLLSELGLSEHDADKIFEAGGFGFMARKQFTNDCGKPVCTENSDPERTPTLEDIVPIRTLIKSMNKNINMLFEIVDKHNQFNNNMVKSTDMTNEDLLDLKKRVAALEDIFMHASPRLMKKMHKAYSIREKSEMLFGKTDNLEKETPNLLEETNDAFYDTMLDKYKNGIIILPKKSVKLQTNITDPIWRSSNEDVASIDSSGNLFAVKPGRAVIMTTSKTQNLLEVTCVLVK